MLPTLKIEIVSHCWSGPDVPIYHHLLEMQYLSLLQAGIEGIKVQHTLVFNSLNDSTGEVVEEYLDPLRRYGISTKYIDLEEKNLFRRAIGRNIAALESSADVIWFTDVDYLFPGQCLRSALKASMAVPTVLVWPRHVNVHRTHAGGDKLIAAVANGIATDFRYEEDFECRTERRAIGGIQIVKGDWARENGYLNDTGWTEPVTSDHFLRCRCDQPFRKSVPQPVHSVKIEDVYRVRHSRAGRDQGKVDHGEKTRV